MTRGLLAALLSGLLASGCATSQYEATFVARGELVMSYDDKIKMFAGRKLVTTAPGYRGLADFVGCVEAAHDQARRAERHGTAGLVLSILGGSLGGLGAGGLVGLADGDHRWQWLSSGLVLAVSGVILAGVGRKLRLQANGQAVDALNYYNDAVGSRGLSCQAPDSIK